MLDHPHIELTLNHTFESDATPAAGQHIFYSAPIDHYFNYRFGRLPYRTLTFKEAYHPNTFQNCGTVNYCDEDIPYTRVAEHKHFWPWESYQESVITYEYPAACGKEDRPYYPIRLVEGNQMYRQYVQQAKAEQGVSFVGRLGTYRYLDMDKAIEEAMQAAEQTLLALQTEQPIPAFFVEPETPE
uniref:Putative UDP-galactopyranose mutase n=1 Tax=Magnetococcus massalia (strain MO-1) TaxID=451514 RepID=A0A1S7LQ06_MAGMO